MIAIDSDRFLLPIPMNIFPRSPAWMSSPARSLRFGRAGSERPAKFPARLQGSFLKIDFSYVK
jgi:hypothetical protein